MKRFHPSGMTAALLAAVRESPGHTAYYYAQRVSVRARVTAGQVPWTYRAASTLRRHGYLLAVHVGGTTEYYPT